MKLLAVLLAAAVMQQAASPIASVSSALNDYNPSLDRTESVMVFARSEAEFQNAKIYVMQRTIRGWDVPVPISFSDDGFSDSDPWLTPDGRTLYFISDRPHAEREPGRTDYDIWRSTWRSGGWSPPERLGPEVNGPGQELGPELHDGILYFSSARRSGRGGLDVYQATSKGSTFEQATLLEGPFNTSENESDFTLDSRGETAMFWRSSGEGGIIHIARREDGEWSPPRPLPSEVNLGSFNFTPSFSSDGTRIRFASTLNREGQPSGLADIYEATLANSVPQ